jgi:hypothetical protein
MLLRRFNASSQNGAGRARLWFVFRMLPEGSAGEPATVCGPPYKVEVRSAW